MSDQYLLKFDLSEFTRQLDDVRASYGDLGSTVEQVFGTSSAAVKELTKNIDALSISIVNTFVGLDDTYSAFNERMKESQSILTEIERTGKGIGSLSLAGVGITDKTFAQIKDIYPGMAEEGEVGAGTQEAMQSVALATEALEMARKALRAVEATKEETKKEISGISGVVKKELGGARQAAGGALSKLMGPISFGGGLIAGLVGAMILGIHYKQRITAEAGEIANVFESSIDGLGSRATQRAIRWISGFQEQAQKFFGIGRKEVQNQVAAYVEMGYRTEQFMRRFDKDLGIVGSNIPTLTLALEKHFNLAGGSAAKNVNDMVAEYGDHLDEAADKFMRLSFVAQQSEIGVSKFINTVMSGSQTMRQYGIDVEDVAQVIQRLQGYYEDMMGPGREQFAGGLAGQALGAAAGGMTRMTQGFQMALAREMYPELEGYAPAQRFRSGFRRIAEGEDEGFFIEYIKKAVDFARRQTGANLPAMIEFLRQNAGWDEQHAQALIELAPSLKAGVKMEEGTQKQLAEFKKTFETEGKTLTDLQKNQNKLIEDFAKLGEGLLKVVSGLLGTIIMGIKIIGPFFRALLSPPKEREKILNAIMEGVDLQTSTLISGLKETGGAVGDIFKDLGGTMSEIFENIEKAAGWQTPVESKENIVESAGQAIGGETGKALKDVGTMNRVMMEGFIIPWLEENVQKPIMEYFTGTREREEKTTEPGFATEPERGETSLSPPASTGGPIARMGGMEPSYTVETVIRGSELLSAINNAEASMAYS